MTIATEVLPGPEDEAMNRLASRAGVELLEGETMIQPQPIREIAPPAWPLPLIASEPKGPRRCA